MNVWDGCERATPLFCAASVEMSRCLTILLSHGVQLNQVTILYLVHPGEETRAGYHRLACSESTPGLPGPNMTCLAMSTYTDTQDFNILCDHFGKITTDSSVCVDSSNVQSLFYSFISMCAWHLSYLILGRFFFFIHCLFFRLEISDYKWSGYGWCWTGSVSGPWENWIRIQLSRKTRSVSDLMHTDSDPQLYYLKGLHELGISAVHCATSANNTSNLTTLLNHGAEPNSVLLFR